MPVFCVAAAALASAPAAAAQSPWAGVWQLDAARSSRTGALYVIATAPDGTMSVTTAGLTFHFRCDDKDYPLPGGRVLSCHLISATQMLLTGKQHGDVLARTLRTLSDDGRTMTAVVTGTAANGQSFRNLDVLHKLSGGAGWDGTWQNAKVQDSSPERMTITASGTTIGFSYPATGASLTAKLDGTPAAQQGPHPAQGDAFSLTAGGPHTINEIETLNGTVVERNALTLSRDGGALTIEVHRTGETMPQTLIYRRLSPGGGGQR